MSNLIYVLILFHSLQFDPDPFGTVEWGEFVDTISMEMPKIDTSMITFFSWLV